MNMVIALYDYLTLREMERRKRRLIPEELEFVGQ